MCMAQYQYKILQAPRRTDTSPGSFVDYQEWQDELNELGMDGWKIVGSGGGAGGSGGVYEVAWVILMK